MAHYQNQYGAQPRTDQYGNPIRQTDEYGNVISETGPYGRQDDEFGNIALETGRYTDPSRRTSEYGVDDPTGRTGAGYGGQQQQQQQQRGGMFQHDTTHTMTGSGGYAAGEQGVHHEKKGMMEKIKEKLPGGHQ